MNGNVENLWDSKQPEPNQFLIHPAIIRNQDLHKKRKISLVGTFSEFKKAHEEFKQEESFAEM